MSDALPIEILRGPVIATKFSAEDEMISGYVARYGETDGDGEQFSPSAFRDSLVEIKASGHRIPLLWMHDMTQPIGSWRHLAESPEGLWGAASINVDTAKGREALSLVRKGDLSGLSVGFTAAVRHGMTISKARLMEASIVSIPSAPKARIKLKDCGTLPELVDALAAGQINRRDLELIVRKAWPSISGAPEDPDQLERLAERLARATRQLKGM